MKRTFAEAMAHRRSYYSIGSDSPVLDEEIVHIIREAVKNVPSAFNSQSTKELYCCWATNIKNCGTS